MTAEETGSYLRHHVTLAGRSDTLFSDDATALIHQTSRGYPRAVNNLALQALVAAFGANGAGGSGYEPSGASPTRWMPSRSRRSWRPVIGCGIGSCSPC